MSNNDLEHKLKIKGTRFIDDDEIKVKLKLVFDGFDKLNATATNVSREAVSTATILYEILKETKYRFFNVIDSINDIIIIKNRENEWKTANMYTQRLFEIKPNEYIGKNHLQLSKIIPKISGFLTKSNITDNEAWTKQSSIRVVETIEFDNNTLYYDFIKTPTFNPDGSKNELIIIGRDITELKEKEKLINIYSSALESVSDIVLIANKSKKILYYNSSNFLKLFNINRKENISLNSIAFAFNNDQFGEFWANLTNNYVYNETIILNIEKNKRKMIITGIPLLYKSVPEYFIISMKSMHN